MIQTSPSSKESASSSKESASSSKESASSSKESASSLSKESASSSKENVSAQTTSKKRPRGQASTSTTKKLRRVQSPTTPATQIDSIDDQSQRTILQSPPAHKPFGNSAPTKLKKRTAQTTPTHPITTYSIVRSPFRGETLIPKIDHIVYSLNDIQYVAAAIVAYHSSVEVTLRVSERWAHIDETDVPAVIEALRRCFQKSTLTGEHFHTLTAPQTSTWETVVTTLMADDMLRFRWPLDVGAVDTRAKFVYYRDIFGHNFRKLVDADLPEFDFPNYIDVTISGTPETFINRPPPRVSK